MTTHELAKKLLAGPDVMAVTPGYEGGLQEAQEAQAIRIAVQYNDKSYYGPHEEVGKHLDQEKIAKCEIVPAVKIY